MNPHDVKTFMDAAGHTATRDDQMLYLSLVEEEISEMHHGYLADDAVQTLDGIIDSIWVLMGFGLSLGITPEQLEAAWQEVARSNQSKIGPDGKVIRRPDGKILKPPTYSPPDIAGILK